MQVQVPEGVLPGQPRPGVLGAQSFLKLNLKSTWLCQKGGLQCHLSLMVSFMEIPCLKLVNCNSLLPDNSPPPFGWSHNSTKPKGGTNSCPSQLDNGACVFLPCFYVVCARRTISPKAGGLNVTYLPRFLVTA